VCSSDLPKTPKPHSLSDKDINIIFSHSISSAVQYSS